MPLDIIAFVLKTHDLRLVAMAVAVCAAGCVAGLRALQLWQGETRYPRSWMWLSLLALGTGIWATHFTAMLGFRPDMLLGFAILPTFGSLLIAVFGAGGALLLGARLRSTPGDLAGGLGAGAAIGVMHGVGVAGLTGCGVAQSLATGVVTALIAGALAALSLWMLRRTRGVPVVAPLLLSAGIAILHFGALADTVLSGVDAAAVSGLTRADVLPLVVFGVLAVAALIAGLMALQAQGEGRARDLAALAQHTTDALASLDGEGRILWANRAFERLTGHAVAGVRGQRLTELMGLTDQPMTDAAALHTAIRQGQAFSTVLEVARADGTPYWADIAIGPVTDAAPGQVRSICTHRDITEDRARAALVEDARRDAEHARTRLLEAIELMPAGFALHDADGHLLLCNGSFRQLKPWLLGEGTRDALARRAVAQGLVVGDTAAVVEAEQTAFARDGCSNLEIACSNGRRLWFQRQRTSTGEAVEVVLDITDRSLREAELTLARHRAEASARAKSSFVSVMSHELRTPLNGILGFASLMAMGPLSEQQQRFVDHISESGQLLLGILNNLLEVASLDNGAVVLELAPVAPAALLHETAAAIGPAAEAKGLAVTVDEIGALPLPLMLDARRVRQALDILADNAVKFTDTGAVTLSLETRLLDGGRVGLAFRVADTGIGIAPEGRETLFDVFAQADGSATRRYGGIGIGLTICRRLVELMGGTVSVESTPGAGSVFTIAITAETAQAGGATTRVAGA